MTDESSPSNCYQVVFLVDSNPSLWATRSPEEAVNTVLLWVLKVLAYFNDHGKGKRSNLRWGYKFFSSRSFSSHVERHDLKEFSLAVFEEFEKHLSKKLNESFAQQMQSVLGQPDGEAVALAKPPAGAKCISCAFTNVVHDFQWNGAGISSPVRTTRGNANLLSNRNTRNVLFLLTGCPCDDSSVEDFGGGIASALTSAESFKNFVMPSVLYREFKELHICLHWVNINVPPDREKNASLEPLLEAFVQEFGGCVIPLSSLYGSICKDLSSYGKLNGSSSHGSLLPFKTVMDFYLARKTEKRCEVINNTQCHHSKDLHSSETRGLLCSSGADIKVHCSLRISSVFQPATKKFCSKNEAGDVQSIVSSGLEASEMPFCPTLVWIRGAINHSQVCPSWLHPVKAYTCIGLDCRLPDGSKNCGSCSKEILSGWFQELLLSLTQENESLVVDFLDCESGLPLSGILQPLTSVCGVISVISSHFLVMFEKLFLWNDKMTMLDRKNTKSVGTFKSSLREFRCRVASKPVEQTMYPEVLIRLIGSHKNPQGTNDASEFQPGIVDPWHPSPVIVDNAKLLWSELRREIECDSEDNHSDGDTTLMRELKLLNKHENMKSKSIACKIKEKHEKCKHGVPKKSERNKNLLKMSTIKIKEAVMDKQDTKLDVEVNTSEECSSTLSSLKTVTNGARKAPCENGDEAQLMTAIHSICDKVIFEGGNIPSEISNILMSVSNFDEKDGSVRDKNSVFKFLNENVLLTMITLREKYEGCAAPSVKEQQVREYQLQILLRTEMAALICADENSALVEEVTDLLRAISFMKDPNFLAVYLKEVILNRYSHSLAKFLCSVYEGLMMRPPRELLTPSKWSGDDESPLRRSVNSVSSVAQNGRQSRSCGYRVLTCHSSVTDGAGKRREIAVPVKTKPKEKGQQKDKSPHSVCAKAVNWKNTGSQKTLVRRNLFTEAEEADEGNSIAKIPKKRKISEGENKLQHKRQLNRRNTVGSLSKTAVQETPSHKQVSHALWSKQDRARKRCRAHTEVHVLDESPLKEIQAGDILPRQSPRKASRVMFQRSHSFYGRSASAGPLTRSRSFTGERTHPSPQNEPTETSEVLLKTQTPKEMSVAAVTPLRVSPRRKKRFSLHSLLSTANESDQVIPSSQVPVTPTRQYMATRSSPRLKLKKRSFSCIGFSSVPFSGRQQNEFSHLCPESGSLVPGGGSPEIPMKIRKNKITEMDECLVLLTPIKNPLKLPVHTSSKVVADTLSSSQVQSQPCGNGSPGRSAWSSCAHNVNVTHPALRSSPKIFSKQEIPDYPKGTTGQSLGKSTEAKVVKPLAVASPNSPSENSVNVETPLKGHHFNDCVVLLTPIKGPLTSPVHVGPVHIDRSVAVDDGMSRDPANLTVNVESWFVTSPNRKSPRSSPQFCLRSSPRNKWKKKSKGLCNSPAETTRLSPLNQILRQQKRKRCLDKCCTVSKGTKSEKSTYRQDDRELNSLNVSYPVVVDDGNSRSSDEVIDWLTEMQRENDLNENKATMSPPNKKPRIHKSVVFGRKWAHKDKKGKKESKTDNLSSDTSFEEEDEVFQSPSAMASSLKRRHTNNTPLSASSIKILQESPILCNSKSPSRRIRTRYGSSLISIDHGRMGTSDVSDAFIDD